MIRAQVLPEEVYLDPDEEDDLMADDVRDEDYYAARAVPRDPKKKEEKEKGQKGATYETEAGPPLGPGKARRDGRLHQPCGPVRQGPDERNCRLNTSGINSGPSAPEAQGERPDLPHFEFEKGEEGRHVQEGGPVAR